jgi:LysR family transcriptional regulator, carnitine catabolism transcriptional activator
MIKLEHLRVFVRVADAGALHEAAEQLGRTQAALSMTLKQMEEALGGSLFESERKGRLTPLGRFALQQARPVVSQYDSAVRDVRNFALGKTGVVKVATVPSAAALWMPAVLSRLRAQRPDVRVELRDIDSRAVIQAVQDDAVDVGIGSVSGSVAGLSVRHLLSDPFVWVCSPAHRLTQLRRAVRWSDVLPEEFIANGLCSGLRVAQLDALVEHASLMVLSTTSLLGFVRASIGVTLLPALAVPNDGSVVALPCAHRPLLRRLDLLTRENGSTVPATQALIEAVIQEASAWQPPSTTAQR